MKKYLLFIVTTVVIVAIYCSLHIESAVTEESVDGYDTEDYETNEINELDILTDKLYRYVEKREIDSLATLFIYPISRKYPTRDILNEQEFAERYEEIFDETFCNKVISDPYNWEAMGWRGYMYDCGDLWVDYSDSLIMSVNVYSELAEKLQQRAIEEEKSTLHESILVHATEPICSFRTKNGEWYGRIDYISPVDNINVQLSLYKSTTSIDSAPDHLLFGREEIQGSAANLLYTFIGDAFNFEIYNPRVYEVTRYPYTLTIEHNYGEVDEGTFDIDWVYWEDLREDYL